MPAEPAPRAKISLTRTVMANATTAAVPANVTEPVAEKTREKGTAVLRDKARVIAAHKDKNREAVAQSLAALHLQLNQKSRSLQHSEAGRGDISICRLLLPDNTE